MTNRYETAFTKTGFSNWNDCGRGLTKHAQSGIHKEAILKLHLTETQAPINAIINQGVRDQQLANNEQLVIVIKALKYLSRQNLAIRGVTSTKTQEVSLKIH